MQQIIISSKRHIGFSVCLTILKTSIEATFIRIVNVEIFYENNLIAMCVLFFVCLCCVLWTLWIYEVERII